MAPLEQSEDMFKDQDDLIDDGAEQIAEDADEEELEDADIELNKKGRGADLEWLFFLQYDTLEMYNASATKKELGGKYSLYAGYSVTTTDPWQNPTEQKDGTIFDYTMMFAVDSNGDFIDDDALTRSDMKQAPFNVKAYKTGDPKDKIQIQKAATPIAKEAVEKLTENLQHHRPNAVAMEKTSHAGMDHNALHCNALRYVQDRIQNHGECTRKRKKIRLSKVEKRKEKKTIFFLV